MLGKRFEIRGGEKCRQAAVESQEREAGGLGQGRDGTEWRGRQREGI